MRVTMLDIAQPHARQERTGPGQHLFATLAATLRGDDEILLDRRPRQEGVALEDVADRQGADILGPSDGTVVNDLPPIGRLQ